MEVGARTLIAWDSRLFLWSWPYSSVWSSLPGDICKRLQRHGERPARCLDSSTSSRRIGRPRLSGKIMGLTVEVDIRVQGTGKSQHTYTRYRVWYPQAGFEFSVSRQTRVSRITMFFGSQGRGT